MLPEESFIVPFTADTMNYLSFTKIVSSRSSSNKADRGLLNG